MDYKNLNINYEYSTLKNQAPPNVWDYNNCLLWVQSWHKYKREKKIRKKEEKKEKNSWTEAENTNNV